MKIATLFHSKAVENSAHLALAAHGVEIARQRDINGLITALREDRLEAALLEDSERQLGHWLSMLQLHGAASHPIIMIIGAGGAQGISRALQYGADDYAVITEGAEALVARLMAQVQLKRQHDANTALQVEGYHLDSETSVVRKDDKEVNLTAREFALAWTLFESKGKVVSLDALSTQIWGRSRDISKRTIEQHVYRLRRKIGHGLTGEKSRFRIMAVYGVGYRLELN